MPVTPAEAPGDALAEAVLAHLTGFPAARRCWVAYSGGRDSSVLLALLARLRPRLRMELRAVHVDHGLQPAAADWADHCARRCAGLGVPCELRRVRVEPAAGKGPEAAARASRYEALARILSPGDLMLTAHHRDDQAETLLLALLRGSGVQGLAAMPQVAPLGAGLLVRPLLGWSRAELHDSVQPPALDWVEDPSNLDLSLDRNFLRARVLPLLAERWPAAGRTLARSAGHCAEAADLVGRYAAQILAGVPGRRPGTLSVEALLGLDPGLCRAVLRRWIHERGFCLPDTRHLGRILAEVLPARADASPLVAWPGCEVRRYRGDLFSLTPGRSWTCPWVWVGWPCGMGQVRAWTQPCWVRGPWRSASGFAVCAAGRWVVPTTGTSSICSRRRMSQTGYVAMSLWSSPMGAWWPSAGPGSATVGSPSPTEAVRLRGANRRKSGVSRPKLPVCVVWVVASRGTEPRHPTATVRSKTPVKCSTGVRRRLARHAPGALGMLGAKGPLPLTGAGAPLAASFTQPPPRAW